MARGFIDKDRLFRIKETVLSEGQAEEEDNWETVEYRGPYTLVATKGELTRLRNLEEDRIAYCRRRDIKPYPTSVTYTPEYCDPQWIAWEE
jgi:hypothetical protein